MKTELVKDGRTHATSHLKLDLRSVSVHGINSPAPFGIYLPVDQIIDPVYAR